jgi:hypothetical protein
MSADNQARRDLAHKVNQAVLVVSSVGMPLGMWCGNGDYARWSQAARDRAGVRALTELDAAIANLTAARDRLAQAVEPAVSDDATGEDGEL